MAAAPKPIPIPSKNQPGVRLALPPTAPQKSRTSKTLVVQVIVVGIIAVMIVVPSVLYILISNPPPWPPQGPRTLPVNITMDSTGNYTMKILQTLEKLTVSGAQLVAVRGGSVLLPMTSLAELDCAGEGATFIKMGPRAAGVEAGDYIQLVGTRNACSGGGPPGNRFAAGDHLEISGSGMILWSGMIH